MPVMLRHKMRPSEIYPFNEGLSRHPDIEQFVPVDGQFADAARAAAKDDDRTIGDLQEAAKPKAKTKAKTKVKAKAAPAPEPAPKAKKKKLPISPPKFELEDAPDFEAGDLDDIDLPDDLDVDVD